MNIQNNNGNGNGNNSIFAQNTNLVKNQLNVFTSPKETVQFKHVEIKFRYHENFDLSDVPDLTMETLNAPNKVCIIHSHLKKVIKNYSIINRPLTVGEFFVLRKNDELIYFAKYEEKNKTARVQSLKYYFEHYIIGPLRAAATNDSFEIFVHNQGSYYEKIIRYLIEGFQFENEIFLVHLE